ncbi:MAG: alkaline phosphatase family protein [Bacteroidales bacterium]|nr:alkaline phosphatase family protein [Bacteroidales bacterium]
MKRYKWIPTLIALLTIAQMQAQQQANVPRLVVVITVDQLRSDYLQHFGRVLGTKGLKRLMQEGIYSPRIEFEFPNVEKSSAIATLFTGSNPKSHGIVFSTLYSDKRELGLPVGRSILQDSAYMGNYTEDSYSPKALLASTVSDELAIASRMQSRIYSIAPDPETAIIGAGHAGNGAFWLDDKTGVWASTTYFNDMPYFIESYNQESSFAKKADNLSWSPLQPIAAYDAFPYTLDEFPFQYTFPQNDKDRFAKLKSTPLVNTEITNIAKLLIDQYELGTKKIPDYLNINYYAGKYLPGYSKEYSLEIQDLYARLDLEIEELLYHIDKKIGLQNALICLTGTGYNSSDGEIPESSRVLKGEFYPDRCVALLNMYLMILYGQEPWVTGYHNQQIFLNRPLIEEKKLSLEEFQKKAAEFVIQFSGVQDVTTSNLLFQGNTNDQRNHFREGMHKSVVGDIQIELEPGWSISYEKAKNNCIRHNAVLAPFILWGAGTHPQTLNRPVQAVEIAPTLTYILRIRPPNACEETPLREFIYPN